MSEFLDIDSLKPEYRGLEWQNIELPTEVKTWIPRGNLQLQADLQTVSRFDVSGKQHCQWRWPKRDICVFTDLHADADAFISSLVASGCAAKTGAMDSDLKLTKQGKNALLIINGDCFDKGPSNLRLLRMIKQVKTLGARLKIIAGNHDIRFLAGIRSLDNHDNPLLSHFFIRMAPKGITFLKEIYANYLAHLAPKKRSAYGENLSAQQVRDRLYPAADWEQLFPGQAAAVMNDYSIGKEVAKIRNKQRAFEALCLDHGLTLSMAYAAVNKWRELFLDKKGEFAWFFRDMKLLHVEASFLFAHAGVDDIIARQLRKKGTKYLNKCFHKSLKTDLFKLYYSPLGNVFRSKYREGDWQFTGKGAAELNAINIQAIVHGHVNHHRGQEMFVRHGIVNFECDASLDYATRRKEGLEGRGAAATLIKKEGCIFGVSVDYPYIKAFTPEHLL